MWVSLRSAMIFLAEEYTAALVVDTKNSIEVNED